MRTTRAEIAEVLASESEWRSLAHHHCYRRDEVEDAISGAIESLLTKLPADALGNPAHYRAWFAVTLKRECWALNRRARNRHEISLATPVGEGEIELGALLPDFGPTPDELAETRAYLALRSAAVGRLKPDERTALLMLGLGASYEEIQAIRGWTHTKVNRCLAEGRHRLRQLVGAAA